MVFRRILKFGWQGAVRNKGLSSQVIFIMIIAMFVLSSLLIFNELSDFLISKARERVDVSVYFNKDASPEEITAVKDNLSDFSDDIEKIEYVSKEQAKQEFIARHQDDPLYTEALNEVGSNPFLPSLRIKAKNPALYARISDFLSTGQFRDLVKKVSFYESEKVIARLFSFTDTIKKAGFFSGLFLIFLVFLITFNTVRLTIFAFRDEISTMKLVGASNWFVRGPFLIQGLLYGFISVIITDIIFLAGFKFLSPHLQSWLFGFNLLDYFQNNFLTLLLWQSVFAVILGLLSSYFAVRKYLKV